MGNELQETNLIIPNDKAVELIESGKGIVAQSMDENYYMTTNLLPPRDIVEFETQLMIAARRAKDKFFYTWEQGAGWVTGPSHSMAVYAASLYRNIVHRADYQRVEGGFKILGVAIDLERGATGFRPFFQPSDVNIGKKFEKPENKSRKESILIQIGVSKAKRGAILEILPKWIVDMGVEIALVEYYGTITDIQERIGAVLNYFSQFEITKDDIVKKFGKELSKFGVEEFAQLSGIKNRIHQGHDLPIDIFPQLKGYKHPKHIENAKVNGDNSYTASVNDGASESKSPPEDAFAAVNQGKIEISPSDPKDMIPKCADCNENPIAHEFAGRKLCRDCYAKAKKDDDDWLAGKKPEEKEPEKEDESEPNATKQEDPEPTTGKREKKNRKCQTCQVLVPKEDTIRNPDGKGFICKGHQNVEPETREESKNNENADDTKESEDSKGLKEFNNEREYETGECVGCQQKDVLLVEFRGQKLCKHCITATFDIVCHGKCGRNYFDHDLQLVRDENGKLVCLDCRPDLESEVK